MVLLSVSPIQLMILVPTDGYVITGHFLPNNKLRNVYVILNSGVSEQ